MQDVALCRLKNGAKVFPFPIILLSLQWKTTHRTMKKYGILSIATAIFILTTMASCSGGNKENNETELDSLNVEPTPAYLEVKGIVGDGSSMNVVEVITESGDTVYVSTPAQMVAGGVTAGDEIDIIYNEQDGEYVGSVAVNVTSLAQFWTKSNAHGQEQGLELCPNGTVVTWNFGTVDYDLWKLEGGKLLLHSPVQVAKEMQEYTDTFLILNLDREELVLSSHDNEIVYKRRQ